MGSCTNILISLAAGAVVVAACRAETPVPDENGLWQIWVSHTNAAADQVGLTQACERFRTKGLADPLMVVVQGLEAWHLLKAGQTNDAARLLEPLTSLTGDPLQKAGAEMARGWLTRLDRELVRAALKRVYLRDVEFPVSLVALKTLTGVKQLPATDRWNGPWLYKPTDLPTIRGSDRQRYVLESARLGTNSDLAQSLAVPYANRITIEPVRVMDGGSAGETVEFSSSARKSALLMVGAEMNNFTFAFMGKRIIVLSDRDHWRVFLKPHS